MYGFESALTQIRTSVGGSSVWDPEEDGPTELPEAPLLLLRERSRLTKLIAGITAAAGSRR